MSIHDIFKAPLRVNTDSDDQFAGIVDANGYQVAYCGAKCAEYIVNHVNAEALKVEPDIYNRAAWIDWRMGITADTLQKAVAKRIELLEADK